MNQNVNNSSIKSVGLTDIGGSKEVAKRLMNLYNRKKDNSIDRIEVVPMLVDVYKTFNRSINPNSSDIDSFFKVLDKDRDNRISL